MLGKELATILGAAVGDAVTVVTPQVSITPVGEQVVSQAQRVLEEAGVVREIARQGRNQLAGPLRLGAIYTIGPYLLPNLVPILTESAPEMPLVIEENYTAVLAEKLKRGELDVIVISLPFEEPGVLTLPLYREPFVLLLPSSHPLNQKQDFSVADLKQEDVLLLGAGHCFRDQVLEFCPECRKQGSRYSNSIQSTIEGGSLETIRYMVASGLGITILPCTACGADRHSGPLYRSMSFADMEPSRVIAIAWRKSFPRLEAVSLIRDVIGDNLPECVRAVAGVEEST
mgnify:CR=1 FL=1